MSVRSKSAVGDGEEPVSDVAEQPPMVSVEAYVESRLDGPRGAEALGGFAAHCRATGLLVARHESFAAEFDRFLQLPA